MDQVGLVQQSIRGLLSGQDKCVSVDQLLNLLKIAHGDRVRLHHKLVQVFCRILGRKAPAAPEAPSTATAHGADDTSEATPASDDHWIRALAPVLAGHMGIPLPCATENKSRDADSASELSLEKIASVCPCSSNKAQSVD